MFVLCAILLTMKEAQRTGKTTQVTVVSPGGMTVTFFVSQSQRRRDPSRILYQRLIASAFDRC